MISIAIYVLIGVLIGVVSGVIGIGGGALLTPILIYGYQMTQKQAQGTSLAMLLAPSGLLAFWEYYKRGDANLKMGLIIAVGVFIGGLFGGKLAGHLSNLTLRRIFAIFLIAIALKMFFQKPTAKPAQPAPQQAVTTQQQTP
jgi:hypothetical protein